MCKNYEWTENECDKIYSTEILILLLIYISAYIETNAR